MLLSDFLHSQYLINRPGLAKGTRQQLDIAVRLLDRCHGRPTHLSDLSCELILGWMRSLAEDRAASTVNSRRRAVVTLWRAAVDEDLIDPPRKWPPRWPEPKRVPVAFTLDQVNRLLAVAARVVGSWNGTTAASCWIAAILLIWDTGIRLGTLLAARLSEFDLDSGLWRCPAEHLKGKRADRLFHLHPQTVAAIRRSLNGPRQRLFPFPYSRRTIWRHFKRLLRAADLPCDRRHLFHCLRRTTESYAAAKMGVEWAASAVGHSAQVARDSYICPSIAPGPSLADAVPRPRL